MQKFFIMSHPVECHHHLLPLRVCQHQHRLHQLILRQKTRLVTLTSGAGLLKDGASAGFGCEEFLALCAKVLERIEWSHLLVSVFAELSIFKVPSK